MDIIILTIIRALGMEGLGCIFRSRIRVGWGWLEEGMAGWGCLVGNRVLGREVGVLRDKASRLRCQ